MQSILALLLASSMIIGAQTQSWLGNYTIDKTTCSQVKCCCFSGTIVVTQSNGTLYVDSGASGSLCYLVTTTSLNTPTPTGYNTTIYQSGGNYVVLTLSSDSNTINIVNPYYTMCAAKAVRSNITVTTSDAEKHVISSMGMVAGIFLGIINRMAH